LVKNVNYLDGHHDQGLNINFSTYVCENNPYKIISGDRLTSLGVIPPFYALLEHKFFL